jgi:hypothetical protein
MPHPPSKALPPVAVIASTLYCSKELITRACQRDDNIRGLLVSIDKPFLLPSIDKSLCSPDLVNGVKTNELFSKLIDHIEQLKQAVVSLRDNHVRHQLSKLVEKVLTMCTPSTADPFLAVELAELIDPHHNVHSLDCKDIIKIDNFIFASDLDISLCALCKTTRSAPPLDAYWTPFPCSSSYDPRVVLCPCCYGKYKSHARIIPSSFSIP